MSQIVKIPGWEHLLRSDFWFSDGNIVVVAGNAAFKVHRGQLERQSEVFRDLFSIPQPKEQELIDGCSWVTLHDRPSEVFHFLSAVYDGLYFKTPRTNEFSVVCSVIRLASKYLVENLRARCIARLELDWPTTLSGWDVREREALDKNGRYVPRETCCHPILLLELAIELNVPHLLPAALYDLSRYGPSKIMCGAASSPLPLDLAASKASDIIGMEKTVTLGTEMLIRTFKGREAAQRYVSSFISNELECRPASAECANRHDKEHPSRQCHESFYFIMLNILRSVGGIACGRDADPLFTLVQANEMLSRTDFSDGQRKTGLKLCHSCKNEFSATTVRAREEVWGLLPFWFGLVDDKTARKGTDLD